MKSSHGTPPNTKSPRGKKDIIVSTTAGGHLVNHPTVSNKPSGHSSPQPRDWLSVGTRCFDGSSMEVNLSPGAPGHQVMCPGQ